MELDAILPGAKCNGDNPNATTLSTISVSCEETKIVIALLVSKTWLELRIQEMSPCMSEIGRSLEEAISYRSQHYQVIQKLETKQSPVEKLLSQADNIISKQNTQPQIFSAMAENLATAWKNLNIHLHNRQKILDQSVNFYNKCKEFADYMNEIERKYIDVIVIEYENLPKYIKLIGEDRKLLLELSFVTMNEEKILLDMLKALFDKNLNDCRPNFKAKELHSMISYIEDYLEKLQERRRKLQVKLICLLTKYQDSLKKLSLEEDIKKLNGIINNFKERINYIGPGVCSNETCIGEYKLSSIRSEFGDIGYRSIQLAKQTENLGDDRLRQLAYDLLQNYSQLMESLESRKDLLKKSFNFFEEAQKIEFRMNQKTSLNSSEEINKVCQDGENILNEAGDSKLLFDGIANKVDELRKGINNNSDNLNKLEKLCDNISIWLKNGFDFLKAHQDMGSNWIMIKDFNDKHRQFQNDLHSKQVEVNALIIAIRNEENAFKNKSERLQIDWSEFSDILDKRIIISQKCLSIYRGINQVRKEMDEMEKELIQEKVDIKRLEEKFVDVQQEMIKLDNSGKNIIRELKQLKDPYLDKGRAIVCLKTCLDSLYENRQKIHDLMEKRKSKLIGEEQTEDFKNQIAQLQNNFEDLCTKIYPLLKLETDDVLAILEQIMKNYTFFLNSFQDLITNGDNIIKLIESTGNEFELKIQLIEQLHEILKNLQKRESDYKLLYSLISSFFQHLTQVGKLIEELENDLDLSDELDSIVSSLNKLGTIKLTFCELIKFINQQSESIIDEINKMEPQDSACFESEKIRKFLDMLRKKFIMCWETNKKKLEEKRTFCQFQKDLKLIECQIEELTNKLKAMRANLADSSCSANATSLAFRQFEKTIELLEQKIKIFLSASEKILDDPSINEFMRNSVKDLQAHWENLNKDVEENRQLINCSVELFTLIEINDSWIERNARIVNMIPPRFTQNNYDYIFGQLNGLIDDIDNDWERKITSLGIVLYGELPDFIHNEIKKYQQLLQSIKNIINELESYEKSETKTEATQTKHGLDETKTEATQTKDDSDVTIIQKNPRAVATQTSVDLNTKNTLFDQTANEVTERLIKATIIKEAEFSKKQNSFLSSLESMKTTYHEIKQENSNDPNLQINETKSGIEQKCQNIKDNITEKIIEPKYLMTPEFVEPLQDLEVDEGGALSLYCRVKGFPFPKIIWYKDGLDANKIGYTTKVCEDGLCTLDIEETLPADSAIFTCEAINELGSGKTQARLKVKEVSPPSKPRFIQELEELSCKIGSSVCFKCEVVGNPTPKLYWYKNDVLLDNEGNTFLYSPKSLDDEGIITVKAVNDLGEQVSSAKIKVLYDIPFKPPFFMEPLMDTTVAIGKPIVLRCIISGVPTPSIYWMHDKKLVKESNETRISFECGHAVLSRSETFLRDSGIYTVVARNISGEATSSCTVLVKGKIGQVSDSEMESDMESMGPKVIQPLVDCKFSVGHPILLETTIIGQPEPEVIWYRDSEPIKESDRVKLCFEGDGCFLKINNCDFCDQGVYKCVAVNSVGEASTQSKVNIIDERCPPKITSLDDVKIKERDTLFLVCNVSGYPIPRVRWFRNDKEIYCSFGQEITEDIENKEYSLIIHSVRSDHAGTYTVKATNEVGEDSNSFLVTILDLESAPIFINYLEDKYVNGSKTIILTCKVKGNPEPEIVWYFDDKEIDPKDKRYAFKKEGDEYSLIISKDVFEAHEKYYIMAHNKIGKAVSTANVYGHHHSLSRLPVLPNSSFITSSSSEMRTFKQTSSILYYGSDKSKLNEKLDKVETKSAISDSKSDNDPILSSLNCSGSKYIDENIKPMEELSPPLSSVKTFYNRSSQVEINKYSHFYDFKSEAQKSDIQLLNEKNQNKPFFVKPLNNMIVNSGDKVVFKIVVCGNPKPNVIWYRNNQEISSKISSDGLHVLELGQVYPKDSCVISVKACNIHGMCEDKADLIVHDAITPEIRKNIWQIGSNTSFNKKKEFFTKIAMEQQVSKPLKIKTSEKSKIFEKKCEPNITSVSSKGNETSLESLASYKLCSSTQSDAEGYLSASEETEFKPIWTPRGFNPGKKPTWRSVKPLISGNFRLNPDSSPLVSTSLSFENDSQRNSSLFQTSHLSQDIKLCSTLRQPVFIKELCDTEVENDAYVILECIVDGYPLPSIKWLHNGIEIASVDAKILSRTDGRICRLIIDRANINATGTYECSATNAIGNVSTRCWLSVKNIS